MFDIVVFVVLFAAAAVVVTIEWRIMRKPASERSEREKRFIASDRKFGKAYKAVVLRVFPIVGLVLFALLLLVSVLFWQRGDVSGGITFSIIGVFGVVTMIVVVRVAAHQRTPDFKAQQEAAQNAADEGGHPRFFISGRAGLALGIGFTSLGAVLLVVQAVLGGSPADLVWPGVVLGIGIVATWAANVQRRAENANREQQ